MIAIVYKTQKSKVERVYYVPDYQYKAAKNLVNYHNAIGDEAYMEYTDDKEPNFNWRRNFTDL